MEAVVGFFRNPRLPEPAECVKDCYGVVVGHSRTGANPIAEVETWMNEDNARIAGVAVLMYAAIYDRHCRHLPTLALSEVIEVLLPKMMQTALKSAEFETSIDRVSTLQELRRAGLPGISECSVETAEVICGRAVRHEMLLNEKDLFTLLQRVLLMSIFVFPADVGHALLMGCMHETREPFLFAWASGLSVVRHTQKRAHFFTALLASFSTAIKDSVGTDAVYVALDVLAGMGEEKFRACDDDTHHIMQISMLTLCCLAVAHIAQPMRVFDDKLEQAISYLLNYISVFSSTGCLLKWTAEMPMTEPLDFGVGDMDLTPLVRAIVFFEFYTRRLNCNLHCIEEAQAARKAAKARPASLVTSGPVDVISAGHAEFMGGICNLMNSVSSQQSIFVQLLRVGYVLGSHCKPCNKPPVDTYVGDHYDYVTAATSAFELAVKTHLPEQENDGESFSNVYCFGLPIHKVLASAVYNMAESAMARPTEAGRCFRRMLQRFKDADVVLLARLIVQELIQNFAMGPVKVAACVFVIDWYKSTWATRLREQYSAKWWSVFDPIVKYLREEEDALAFWISAIHSLAAATWQARQCGADTTAAERTLADFVTRLKREPDVSHGVLERIIFHLEPPTA